MRCLCALALAFSCLSTAHAGDRPLPDDDAVSASLKLVLETYGGELRTEDGLRSLLKAADAITDDDAGQVAIYSAVQRQATKLGCYRLGFVAIDRMASRYDVDGPAMKLAYLDTVSKAAKSAEQRASVVNQAMQLADAAEAAGDFDHAEKAIKVASAFVGKLRDPALRKEVAAKRREIEKRAKEQSHANKEINAALDRLKDHPNDPKDNELVGIAVAKQGDWQMAPIFLKSAESADLRAAAKADIAGGETAAAQAKIGDLWWAAGKDFRPRAAFWYTRALSGSTGIVKARLEKRIKEAGEVAGGESGGGKTIDVVLGPGVVLKMVSIPASADGKVAAFWLGQTEVTEAQWAAVMGRVAQAPTRPKTDIGFDDCERFIEKLGEASFRLSFRFPTDGELQYAWAAGKPDDLKLPSIGKYAWVKESSRDTIHNVAETSANTLGIFDLSGNVWEWVEKSVVVGGGFESPASACMDKLPASNQEAGKKLGHYGLRVAADLR